ncbi:hypothetical protein CEP52_006697 [Fusarium oligoseptatum]|uniref:Uncharacterized protein n=1 Tax=Fusarium oligoseptatum TaxID=2604345 RepID=A0A428TRP3_9HYPO|nr:hypothetical protein CEP52_006697 [Fusarium oligoseptatum]
MYGKQRELGLAFYLSNERVNESIPSIPSRAAWRLLGPCLDSPSLSAWLVSGLSIGRQGSKGGLVQLRLKPTTSKHPNNKPKSY